MSFVFEKHFSLQQANILVPALRELFHKVHQLMEPTQEEVLAWKEDKPVPGKKHHGNGNGNGKSHGPARLTPEERIEAANELLKSVAARGIVIQDWRRGLIDFPAVRDGREILLCYELADGDTVQYFHDLDSGFAGREPL